MKTPFHEIAVMTAYTTRKNDSPEVTDQCHEMFCQRVGDPECHQPNGLNLRPLHNCAPSSLENSQHLPDKSQHLFHNSSQDSSWFHQNLRPLAGQTHQEYSQFPQSSITHSLQEPTDLGEANVQVKTLWSSGDIEYAQTVASYSTSESLSSWTGESFWSSQGSTNWASIEGEESKRDLSDFSNIHFTTQTLNDIFEQCSGDQADTKVLEISSDSSCLFNSKATGKSIGHPFFEQKLSKIAHDLLALQRQSRENSSHGFDHINNSTSFALDIRHDKGVDESESFVTQSSDLRKDLIDCVPTNFASDLHKTTASKLSGNEDSDSSVFSSCPSSRSQSHSDMSRYASEESLADVTTFAPTASKHKRRARPRQKNRTKDPSLCLMMKAGLRDVHKSTKLHYAALGRPEARETDSGRSSTSEQDNISLRPSQLVASEASELNPNSKPFYPRGFAPHAIFHESDQVTSNVKSETTWGDSGITTAQEQTSHFNWSQETRSVNLTDTFNETCLSKLTPFNNSLDLDPRAPARNSDIKNKDSPYKCDLSHENEFTPIEELSSAEGLQAVNPTNLNTILSISQRVVRLCVRKPLAGEVNPKPCPATSSLGNLSHMADQSGDPNFEHYGTGFALRVDKDQMWIRTHSAVVGNCQEAVNTRVDLVLTLPGSSLPVECFGEREGFTSSLHSDTVVFKCKTPPQLLPFLHLFEQVPVLRRDSFFNDSCYFTDLTNPDTSAAMYDQEPRVNEESPEPARAIKSGDHAPSSANTNIGNSVGTNFLKIEKSETPQGFSMFTQNRPSSDSQTQNLTDGTAVSSRPSILEQPKSESAGNVSVLYADVLKCGLSQLDNWQHANVSESQWLLPDTSPSRQILQEHERQVANTGKSTDSDGVEFVQKAGSFQKSETMDVVPVQKDSQSSTHQSMNINNLTPTGTSCFDYCKVQESIVRQAFESVDAFEYPFTPSNSLDDAGVLFNCCSSTSADNTGTASKRVQNLREEKTASPLGIMERRAEETQGGRSHVTCPYMGQNIFCTNGLYTNFSSHAGDIFSSICQTLLPGQTSASHERDDLFRPRGWEYEALVYAQTMFRQDSKRLYKHWNIPSAVSQEESKVSDSSPYAVGQENKNCVQTLISESTSTPSSSKLSNTKGSVNVLKYPETREKTRVSQDENNGNITAPEGNLANESRVYPSEAPLTFVYSSLSIDKAFSRKRSQAQVFEEFESTESYLNTWDRNLLNLDDKINPLPEWGYFENMVDQLVFDENSGDSGYVQKCCKSERFSMAGPNSPSLKTSRALIVSHPHGGPKMLSSGLFSSHCHVGGMLYDTATCMGSCGAPVIALPEDGSTPYVTHFVHDGTIRVNDVFTGIGTVYFDHPELREQ